MVIGNIYVISAIAVVGGGLFGFVRTERFSFASNAC